jgi:hypothetical protein
LDSTRCNGKIGRCSKKEYRDVSIIGSSSVISKITREDLNCHERYCVLGVMSDGNWIRCAVAIFFDVGDMAIGYVVCGGVTYCDVGDMAMEYVETTSRT